MDNGYDQLDWSSMGISAVSCFVPARSSERVLWLVSDPWLDAEWHLRIHYQLLPQHLHIWDAGIQLRRIPPWHGFPGDLHIHLRHLGSQRPDRSLHEPLHMDPARLCVGKHCCVVYHRACLQQHSCVWWFLHDICFHLGTVSHLLAHDPPGGGVS